MQRRKEGRDKGRKEIEKGREGYREGGKRGRKKRKKEKIYRLLTVLRESLEIYTKLTKYPLQEPNNKSCDAN